MLIEGFNVRVTEGKLWIPRRDDKVIKVLDAKYERTNPTELMWNENKPKEDTPEEVVEDSFPLWEDQDLDGDRDED